MGEYSRPKKNVIGRVQGYQECYGKLKAVKGVDTYEKRIEFVGGHPLNYATKARAQGRLNKRNDRWTKSRLFKYDLPYEKSQSPV